MKMSSSVSMLKSSQAPISFSHWEVFENPLHPQRLFLSYAIHSPQSQTPPARMRNKGDSEQAAHPLHPGWWWLDRGGFAVGVPFNTLLG